MMIGSEWIIAFTAGLLTPLGAACVLPLYPGYLSFLSGQSGKVQIPEFRIFLGIIAGAGILVSMLLFGLIVVSVLSLPLSGALGFISPVVYGMLLVIGILLVIGWHPDFSLPTPRLPPHKTPYIGAFLFGLFFGLLVLPCNAAPVAVLLALSTSTSDMVANMVNFILFGAGMAVPLILLSALSSLRGNEVTRFLADHKRTINIVTGILMIAVACYYLLTFIGMQGWV